MKKAILLTILCAVLMTGCEDYYDDEPEIRTETADITETILESGEVSDEVNETCSDTILPEVPETIWTEEVTEISEIQEITAISEENVPYEDEYEEEQEPEIIEIPEETAPEPTEAQPEVTSVVTEEMTETSATEPVTETETVPETVESTETTQTEPIPETELMTEPFTETVPEQEITDFEKAQSVYEYMLENGHGICVNYACQTYEKCLEIGLPCYIVWTDAGIYGHTANAVCVNDIWFVMDTQAGGFLESNYGFTEVVNMDCEHIADGDILSNYSYQELFQSSNQETEVTE